MIERINQLSKKFRQHGLTEAERQEQQELRRKYIECIKKQLRDQLDSIEFVDGNKCQNDRIM